jgi:hypothetical protein
VVLREEALAERIALLRSTVARLRRASSRNLDLDWDQWALERGMQLAAQALFDVGNHVLAGAFAVRPKELPGVRRRGGSVDPGASLSHDSRRFAHDASRGPVELPEVLRRTVHRGPSHPRLQRSLHASSYERCPRTSSSRIRIAGSARNGRPRSGAGSGTSYVVSLSRSSNSANASTK